MITFWDVCVPREKFFLLTKCNENLISWVHRGYHEYIRGCSVHRRDTKMHVGNIMSTLGDVQYIGRIPWCMWGDIMIHLGTSRVHRGFQYKSKAFINLLPHMNHDIPAMYSWYPSNVLNIPRCTEHTLYRVNILMLKGQFIFTAN